MRRMLGRGAAAPALAAAAPTPAAVAAISATSSSLLCWMTACSAAASASISCACVRRANATFADLTRRCARMRRSSRRVRLKANDLTYVHTASPSTPPVQPCSHSVPSQAIMVRVNIFSTKHHHHGKCCGNGALQPSRDTSDTGVHGPPPAPGSAAPRPAASASASLASVASVSTAPRSPHSRPPGRLQRQRRPRRGRDRPRHRPPVL